MTAKKTPAKTPAKKAPAKKTVTAKVSASGGKAIRGTVAELVDTVTINGKSLTQPQLSVITQVFGKEVGKDAKPANVRGRAATVWEFPASLSVRVARK